MSVRGPAEAVTWTKRSATGAPTTTAPSSSPLGRLSWPPSTERSWPTMARARASPRRGSANLKEIETCAPCHSRREQLREGRRPGEPLLASYRPALLTAPLPMVWHQEGAALGGGLRPGPSREPGRRGGADPFGGGRSRPRDRPWNRPDRVGTVPELGRPERLESCRLEPGPVGAFGCDSGRRRSARRGARRRARALRPPRSTSQICVARRAGKRRPRSYCGKRSSSIR